MPQWEAVSDCGKILTAVGSLLCRTMPGPLPGDFTVKSDFFRSAGNYYEGPSVRSYGLVNKEFTLAVCINMNPEKTVKAKLSFGKNKVYDLVKMAPAQSTLELSPGEGVYFLIRGSGKEIAEVYGNRCQREEARLALLQDIAKANKLPVVQAEKTASAQARYHALLKAQTLQKGHLASSPVGKTLEAIRLAEKLLDEADYILCTFGTAFRKKQIPQNQLGVTGELLADFRELNKLKTERRNGFAPDSEARAQQLLSKVQKDLAQVRELKNTLIKSGILPDDPLR